MPRAFLVKHKKSTRTGDRTDSVVSSDVSEEFYDNKYKDSRGKTNSHPDGENNIEFNVGRDRTVPENTTSKVLQDKLRTLPCLTIPRPFPSETSNVLRSMLYKTTPDSKKASSSADDSHNSSPSTSPLVKASAHSAFDRVVPGAPRSRYSPYNNQMVHQHTAYRISHVSKRQHPESQGRAEVKTKNMRESASSSFSLHEEDTMTEQPAKAAVGNKSVRVDNAEPLDLQVKRHEDRDVPSRPNSVESNTNSRESVSPFQNDSGDHLSKKKYFMDRHQTMALRGVDISPPAGSGAGCTPATEFALRTPHYLPSTPRFGDFRDPMNWTYAAYYQQYAGPYVPFYSSLSRHMSAVPGDLRLQQQSFPASTASSFTAKRHLITDAKNNESYHSDNNSSKSPSNPSPSSPSRSETAEVDETMPDKSPSRRPEYLAEHLNTIRMTTTTSTARSSQLGNHRPVARQPILGLEYIQNGNDMRSHEIGKDELGDDADRKDGLDGELGEEDALEDEDDEHVDMDPDNHLMTARDGDIQSHHFDIDANMDDNVRLVNHGDKDKMASNIKPPQPKKYKCDICFKGFSRSNTLVTHKRIHTGDKPFKCELCGRAFRQPGNLTRHRLTHTTVKPYVCPQCDKAFNRASNLHTHMRTHTNYKPFTCPYCSKGFHQKIDMKIHSYTHTGEKPHKCKTCGRGFKQLTHLTYHMRTHSTVKMYTCTYCGKGFNQKGNLQAHIYGHTGERPYRCEICDKGFTLASTLNTHRRTHAEKKPFQCQYCQKEFYQKNALKSHLIASHPYTGESLL